LLLVTLCYPEFADAERVPGEPGAYRMPFRTDLFSRSLGAVRSAQTLDEVVRALASGGLMTIGLAITAAVSIAAAWLRSRALAAVAGAVLLFAAASLPIVLFSFGGAGGGSSITQATFLVALRDVSTGAGDGAGATALALVRVGAGFVPDVLLRLGGSLWATCAPALIGLYAALAEVGGRAGDPAATPKSDENVKPR